MNLARTAASRAAEFAMLTAAMLLDAAIVEVAHAAEAGQGTFHASLVPGIGCGPGQDALIDYDSTFQFDDKTFHLNLPPGNNTFEVNFSELGVFHSQGKIHCVFDRGGTFTTATAVNEAGDFQWVAFDGEYTDRKPGIGVGDPFPWVAGARCITTRTDEFKTLCDNFELSWNGLGKALEPTGGYNDYAGDLNVRAVRRVEVQAGNAVSAPAEVDGAGGSVPEVEVHFRDGVTVPGELSISTLADAHGDIPHGAVHPVAGTTEIDHGSGAQPFFEGGDERFIEIGTDAALPSNADIEVCLPEPAVADASQVRPVRVLHGEEDGAGSRKFVDRTSRRDLASRKVCASVSSLSKFAVVTTDVCGNGRKSADGILTVAGGLVGRKNVIVDGVTDCAGFPAHLPTSWAELCVPDADDVAGSCSLALTLGVVRAGCNQVSGGVDPAAFDVDPYSYAGQIRGKAATIDLEPLYRAALYGLGENRAEATIGPVTVALPAYGAKAKYRLKHAIFGSEPGSGSYVRDKDSATITCVTP